MWLTSWPCWNCREVSVHLINFAVHVEVILVSGILEMLFSYLLSVEKEILDPGII